MIKFLTQFIPPRRGKNKNNSGFTLVETLVAISIFTISILALMSVLGKGMSDVNYAKQQMTASYLAQEGIEYVRNMRDTFVLSDSSSQDGWNNFVNNKISQCISDKPCGFNSLIPQADPEAVFFCLDDMSQCKLYVESGNFNANFGVLGVDSGFVRTIYADTAIGNGEIKIVSTVSWNQGSGSHSVTFSENLYNWIE